MSDEMERRASYEKLQEMARGFWPRIQQRCYEECRNSTDSVHSARCTNGQFEQGTALLELLEQVRITTLEEAAEVADNYRDYANPNPKWCDDCGLFVAAAIRALAGGKG